jgi:L-lactate dehydrogenase complex protein LldG
MTKSSRSRIFAKVRHSSRGASAEFIREELDSFGKAPSAELPATDTATAFLANVLRNQGTAACAANRTDAVREVGQYLYQHYRTHRLVAGSDPRLAAMPWRDAGVLPRFGAAEGNEPAALSYARLGVAETGAIVTFTGKANPAANNLLAEHHIVVVDCEDLVGDMEEAWVRIRREVDRDGRPRGINFIAGPSSTADIEGQLVYGAHGPRGWHVILLGHVPDSTLDDARELAAG